MGLVEVTERLLAEHLEKMGGRIERSVEVARVEPQPDGAVATLLHADGKWEKVRCRWVVGCDGASSAVRIGLGLPFDGVSYEERFLNADVAGAPGHRRVRRPCARELGERMVWLDADGSVHERFGAGSECLYLIRPDGHVGFRAQPARQESLESYLSRVLL